MRCWRGLRGTGASERRSGHCFRSRSRCGYRGACSHWVQRDGRGRGPWRSRQRSSPSALGQSPVAGARRLRRSRRGSIWPRKTSRKRLTSEDSRRRDAASFFVVRNSARAKRRGWITSASAGVDVNVNLPPRETIFSWRPYHSEQRSAEQRAEEEHRQAELKRARAEGLAVVEIGWGDPGDGKTIEGEVATESSSKD